MSVVLQPTMRMGGRIFWAYFWRAFLVGLAAGIVVGLISAGLYYVFPPLVAIVKIIGTIASIGIGVVVFSIIFDKRYTHYTVKLVDNVTGEVMPRHWQYGLRPWWSYAWRCAVIGAAFMIPAGLLTAYAFAPELKLAQTQGECQQIMVLYKQFQEAGDTANMQATEQAFQARQCPAAFEPQTEQQVAVTKAKARGLQVGFFVGLILAIAIQFKIFQIVLRKRYERFHVQVTANEGAAV